MPSIGTGMNSNGMDSNDDKAISTISVQESSEQLEDFWHSLPRSRNLKSQGITRVQKQKSQHFLDNTLNELVGLSLKAEEEEAERIKYLQELNEKKSASLLDGSRFLESEENALEEKLEEDVNTYWNSMTKSWASERAELEADLQRKIEQRTKRPRSPKVIQKSIRSITTSASQRSSATTPIRKCSDLSRQVYNQLEQIQAEALSKTISKERKKEIKGEIEDMDLCSRPTHFLNTQMTDRLDPLDGAEDVGVIYSKVKKMVSQETLDRLLNPPVEPHITSEGDFMYEKEEDNPNSTVFNPFKTELDSMDDEKIFESRLDEKSKENLDKIASGLAVENFTYELDNLEDAGFELNCLRELVNLQEGEGWTHSHSDVQDFPSISNAST